MKQIIDIRTQTVCVITYLASSNREMIPEMRVLLTHAETGDQLVDVAHEHTEFPAPELPFAKIGNVPETDEEDDYVLVPRDLYHEVSQVLEEIIRGGEAHIGRRPFKTLARMARYGI